jgi:transcriptional regulator NrdR family protein
MQLRVMKTDGSVEEYLHTKVVGTISHALGRIDHSDVHIAEELAEVVTYFLYRKQKPLVASSSEILSIIEAVLTATGYEDAAVALSEHHFERRLKRSRVEVVAVDVQQLSDADALAAGEQRNGRCRWDKSRIVKDLMTKHDLSRQTARTIASMVEEKIFNVGVSSVPVSLIKQLVLGDAAAVLRAERQLQTV